jgi:hypothetical protein
LTLTLGWVSVHHIGGEENWKDLLYNSSNTEGSSSQVVKASDIEAITTSFSL